MQDRLSISTCFLPKLLTALVSRFETFYSLFVFNLFTFAEKDGK